MILNSNQTESTEEEVILDYRIGMLFILLMCSCSMFYQFYKAFMISQGENVDEENINLNAAMLQPRGL